MKSWIKKHWTMSFDMESILKILKRYLRKFQKVLKKDISWTHKQNTIVLVYRDEIEQFHALMNNGLSIDTLIHLVFKESDAIIEQLKLGKNLVEIFCIGQKKLYFKYIEILSNTMNLSDVLDCVNQIEKSSILFYEKLLKKIAYPFFLLIFAYFMICFFSNYVLVQMKDYIPNNVILIFVHLLKYLFGITILVIVLYILLYYVFLYRYNSKLKCPFRLMKKMISLQFVCMYQSLEKTCSSTQEILETLSSIKFSVVGIISSEILKYLMQGVSIEESFNRIKVFDSTFKKMLNYALVANSMSFFLDLYIQKSTLDIEKSIKKISNGVQIFSYISIGILVLIVYQIMMMPLNMLNQF